MAMNKKEQAEFDAAKREVLIARALSWPSYVPEWIQVEVIGAGECPGWTYNAYNASVDPGCFNSVSHYRGALKRPKGATGSQGVGGPWYATKLDATRALRIALTRQYAEKLAAVDARITELEQAQL